jgi:ABC-type polysaccharide/polyol phosphate export permease
MLAIHRHLLMQLVVRDVAGRYKGSIGGAGLDRDPRRS